jgi:hypothetical protein
VPCTRFFETEVVADDAMHQRLRGRHVAPGRQSEGELQASLAPGSRICSVQ